MTEDSIALLHTLDPKLTPANDVFTVKVEVVVVLFVVTFAAPPPTGGSDCERGLGIVSNFGSGD